MEKYKSKFTDAEEIKVNAVKKIASKTQKKFYEIIWNNDPQLRPAKEKDNELWDSFKPYDIEIIRKEEGRPDKIKKYEVKGTLEGKVHFFLSGREWQTYLSDPQSFRLWVVTNVGTENAQVTPIKDLMEYLKERRILPISSTEFRAAV